MVSLAITGVIMLALVELLGNILHVAAVTQNRSKLREDLLQFSQEFEKDFKNAAKIGDCGGITVDGLGINLDSGLQSQAKTGNFKCDVFTQTSDPTAVGYEWAACLRTSQPDVCLNNAGNCNSIISPYLMCKYYLRPNANVTFEGANSSNSTADTTNGPILEFDYNNSIDQFGAITIAREEDPNNLGTAKKTVIYFYAIASNPYKPLNIQNMLRTSILSTKNYDNKISN